jgi:hypothetical protein
VRTLGLTALVAAACASGLTLAVGVALPVLLLPGRTLAPIVGFVFAPPAFALGAGLGWIVCRWARSYPSAIVVGCAYGAVVGLAIIVVFSSGEPDPWHRAAFYCGCGGFVFGVTGVVARYTSR